MFVSRMSVRQIKCLFAKCPKTGLTGVYCHPCIAVNNVVILMEHLHYVMLIQGLCHNKGCSLRTSEHFVVHGKCLVNVLLHVCSKLTWPNGCRPAVCQPNVCGSNVCRPKICWPNVCWPNVCRPNINLTQETSVCKMS